MKVYKTLTILILFIFTITSFSFAQEQEATESSEVNEQAIENLIQRVKGNPNQNQIYSRSGIVKEVNETSLALQNATQEANIEVSTDAALLKFTPSIGNAEITLEDIALEEYVIAMGYQSQAGNNLLAKRLVVTPAPTPATPRKLITGTVAEIDSNIITISNSKGEQEITYDSQETELEIEGAEEAALDDILVDDDIAVIYSTDENKLDMVKYILVIPGEANPESEENVVE